MLPPHQQPAHPMWLQPCGAKLMCQAEAPPCLHQLHPARLLHTSHCHRLVQSSPPCHLHPACSMQRMCLPAWPSLCSSGRPAACSHCSSQQRAELLRHPLMRQAGRWMTTCCSSHLLLPAASWPCAIASPPPRRLGRLQVTQLLNPPGSNGNHVQCQSLPFPRSTPHSATHW